MDALEVFVKLVNGIRLRVAGLLVVTGGVDPSGNVRALTVGEDGSLSSSVPGISVPVHDYIAIAYVGSTNNINTVTYKTGGSGGTTVAVLTMTYSGGVPSEDDAKIATVTKS